MSPRDWKSRAVDQLGCRSMVDVTSSAPSWKRSTAGSSASRSGAHPGGSSSTATIPGTQFYLDPPHWGLENDYGAGVFTRAEFVGLAARLGRIAGRFILSGNDVPETRETFRRFAIETAATRYAVPGKWSDVSEGRRHRPASKAAARLARSAVVLAWRLG